MKDLTPMPLNERPDPNAPDAPYIGVRVTQENVVFDAALKSVFGIYVEPCRKPH